MGVLQAQAIYCPKEEDHPRKKILLLLHEDKIYVHCKDHGWIMIELTRFGKKMNFDGIAVVASSTLKNTHFDLTPIPVLAVGDFVLKND